MNAVIRFVLWFACATILLSLFLAIAYFIPKIDILFDGSSEIKDNIGRIHDASLILLTIGLIVVALTQLLDLNKTSKSDFLLKIYAMYGSREIVKARAIIQRLYRNANPDPKNPVPRETYIRKMAEEIDNIRHECGKKSCEEFSYLLNLLDFLETVGFFSRKKYISAKDVDELIGNSVVFYYDIFRSWIYYRRKTYENSSYYCEFEELVEKIKSYQQKEKLSKTCMLIRFFNFFRE
ncbi:MAG TPA: hypothetical protein VNC84_07730 [Gammaproteobacteria bacterium]|nr:hypothetical protein [Gammaproteobacteria bacterium]